MNVDVVKANGIVGAGGAGFPTHIKLQSKVEIVILNAAECEPLLHKDEQILLQFPEIVIEGFLKIIEYVGAKRGIIAIKRKRKKIIEVLKKFIKPPVELYPLGDFYPAGDEVTLIYTTTGRLVQPGHLPVSVGCLVQNVETVYNIAVGNPVVEKFLTVAGTVETPLTIKVPVGISIGEVLSHFKITAANFIVRTGGMMMGEMITDLSLPVTKTLNGLIILPADHPASEIYFRYSEEKTTIKLAKSNCDQCSFCTDLCPRYLLGHPVRPETAMRNAMFRSDDLKYVHSGNAFCCECNLCTIYSCPEGLDPKGATVIEKKIALKSENKWQGLPVRPHPLFDYRKVPTKKLKQRLGIANYRDDAPYSELKISPAKVSIPLKQHIGEKALPVVSAGDIVERFDLIAEAQGDISANIHASIEGKVTEINEQKIVIERNS